MKRFFEKFKGVKPIDVLHIFLFVAALPIALVYKLFRRDLWLICDNGAEASDNGYWLYEYIRREHPEQDCLYAVNKNSRDRDKVAALGKPVNYGSFLHWILYLTAKVNISSQKGGKPNYAVCYLLEVYGILRNKRVFLQHGVILTDIEFLYYENTKMDMFVTSTYREWEYVNSHYGYPEGVVQLLGLTRFDRLHDFETVPKQILIMPTWREWLGEGSLVKNIEKDKENFVSSDYYKRWSAVIKSDRLREICEKYGCTVMFCPHRDTQRFLSCFETDNPYLTVCDYDHFNVQELLKSSAFMITDFSSVQIDFAYMKKPLAYFHFDYKEYTEHHYHMGYYSYEKDGFGPAFSDENELLSYVEQAAANNFVNDEKYLNRHSEFFTLYDTDNCKRNYEAIKERYRSIDN